VPTRIRVLVAAAVVFAFALFAALASTVRTARDGVDLIGHHSGPTVVSTSDLYLALSDMDAQLVNVLLVGARTDLGVTRASALDRYERRRLEVDGYLQRIAAYAGHDAATGRDLRAVLNALGRYHGLAAQTLYAHAQSTVPETGRPAQPALDLYRQATDVMHDDLLPAAQRMIGDEAAQVEHEYSDARSSAAIGTGFVVLFGFGLLAVLLAVQILLARDHHRVFNPAIAVATLATVGVLGAGLFAVTDAEEHLRVAKEDAFDYTVTLHQARAVGQDALADQGRFLLDPGRAQRYESAFHDKSQQLLRTDASGVATYDAALGAALSTYFTARRTVRFDGLLGRSLRHVAFPGELAAGENTLRGYQAFQAADRRLRAAAAGGDLIGAIRSYTGATGGGTSATFNAYAGALGTLITINERGFEGAVEAGEHSLSGWTWPPAVLAGLVTVLVLVGAAPRLAEYRA
jgi:hypothetical protein